MLRETTRGWGAVTLVVVGLAVVVLAASISRMGPGGAEALTPDRTIVLRGPGDVGVVTMIYEPGRSSGWHAHTGLHAVAVLSGELTIYDGECRPQRVVAGEPYVGGQDLHLARNETGGPVDMIVTYLNAVGPPAPRLDPPAGCPVR